MSFEIEPNSALANALHPSPTGFGANPFGAAGFAHPLGGLSQSDSLGPGLGREYLMSDSGALSPVSHAHGHGSAPGKTTKVPATTPAPTMVGSASGLQFDLIWDPSVASAPTGFQTAIIGAAQQVASLYSNRMVVSVDVGYGEIGGSALGAGALGESESYGYLLSYGTVTSALHSQGYSFSASNEPTTSQFFTTSAETKALGLINPLSTSPDGFVGFTKSYPLYYGTSGTPPSNQYDLYAIAEHELTEVMGRIGMENTYQFNGKATYTPLDLFNYSQPGVLSLSPNGGYFSTDNGATNRGMYNNAAHNGGDIADWSSLVANDAFDAFTSPGVAGAMTSNDALEVAALGYKLSATA
ncbi:MAG TPA: NF038122 family metalloprotease [Roseiarcus sp.]|nr:NF038122 family metalloprotease [Roseiarcus sp.]